MTLCQELIASAIPEGSSKLHVAWLLSSPLLGVSCVSELSGVTLCHGLTKSASLTCITKKDVAKGIKVYEGNTYGAPYDIQGKESEVSEEASFLEDLDRIKLHSITCQVVDLPSQLASLTFTFQALANSLSTLTSLIPIIRAFAMLGYTTLSLLLPIPGLIECPALPEHSSSSSSQLTVLGSRCSHVHIQCLNRGSLFFHVISRARCNWHGSPSYLWHESLQVSTKQLPQDHHIFSYCSPLGLQTQPSLGSFNRCASLPDRTLHCPPPYHSLSFLCLPRSRNVSLEMKLSILLNCYTWTLRHAMCQSVDWPT